jgi:phosphatidylglycerophosphate synthase
MEYLKDKYLLLPFVKNSDFIHTKFKLTPNHITLINAFVITGFLFYYWYINNFFYAFIFLFLRNLLDGIDGYIARKYDKYSKTGDIYDHMSDCVFIGLYFQLALLKLNFLPELLLPICNTVIMTTMVLQFSGDFEWFSINTVGAGGSYESYCSLYYILGHIILLGIYYM